MHNTPILYSSIAELASCIIVMCAVPRKRSLHYTIAITALYATVLLSFASASTVIDRAWFPARMAVIVLLMVMLLHSTIELPWQNTVYCAVKAFIISECIASLRWHLVVWNTWFVTLPPGLQYLLEAVFLIDVCFIFALFEQRAHSEHSQHHTSWQELLVVMLIGTGTFVISNAGLIWEHTVFDGVPQYGLLLLRTICDAMGLTLLYAFDSKITQIEAQRDLEAINAAMRNQLAAYSQYQNSIDIINIKYHDLKHQLEALRNSQSRNHDDTLLHIIETELQHYSPLYHTGNAILDALLDTHRVTYIRHHIALTVMADGKLVSMLSTADILSLFGNILDNAIEATTQIRDPEKRCIRFNITQHKDCMYIDVENTYATRPVFRHGLPQTTQDGKQHGFGVRSMCEIVQRYHGEIFFETQDSWFIVRALIPLNAAS